MGKVSNPLYDHSATLSKNAVIPFSINGEREKLTSKLQCEGTPLAMQGHECMR